MPQPTSLVTTARRSPQGANKLARGLTPALLHRRAETTLSLLMLLHLQQIKAAARQAASGQRQAHMGHHAKHAAIALAVAQPQRPAHGRHALPAHGQAQAGARAARSRLKRQP